MNLAFIPARGGSKGIPNKNIKLLNGMPLIYWSIKSAKESKKIDKVIVSTDSQEIENIAIKFDVEVLNRPKYLANDTAKTIDVLKFHKNYLSLYDNIVILQPTSPLRPKSLIDNCINIMENQNYSNLATGYMCKNIEYGTHNNLRRQDFEGFFYDDGSVYVTTNKLISSSQWVGENPYCYINEKQFTYEIDDLIDFKILEILTKEYNV